MNNLEQTIYNKEFRKKICENPYQHAKDLGVEIQDDVKVVVVKNTKATYYFPMISHSINQEIDLSGVSAAKASTFATGSTASTIGSATSCMSSAGSVGTLGTAM